MVTTVEIRNAGRSTAFIQRMNLTSHITPPDLEIRPSYSAGNDRLRGPITPNGADFEIVISNIRLPNGVAAAIQSGQRKLYHLASLNGEMIIVFLATGKSDFATYTARKTHNCH
jgi:hypothetical protein